MNHTKVQYLQWYTSPTQTGSIVGNLYTAISLGFSAPVANRVLDGFNWIEWIPQELCVLDFGEFVFNVGIKWILDV